MSSPMLIEIESAQLLAVTIIRKRGTSSRTRAELLSALCNDAGAAYILQALVDDFDRCTLTDTAVRDLLFSEPGSRND